QQLGADQAGHAVVDGPDDEDDPLLQEARIDVIGALAAVGLLDHHRHQQVVVGLDGIAVSDHGAAYSVAAVDFQEGDSAKSRLGPCSNLSARYPPLAHFKGASTYFFSAAS